jgi:hypothetical protein
MELIIIGALTTIALITMQAIEFLQTRRRSTTVGAEAAPQASLPASPPRLQAEDESLEQAA